MGTVFVLQHLHVLLDGEEDVKMIGVYESRGEAEAAVARLCSQPGFSSFPCIVQPKDAKPDGFYIDEYTVGEDHWTEGFVTV